MKPERWDVEWVTDVPSDEEGPDPDKGTHNVRSFASEERAVIFATTVAAPVSFWGYATVTPVARIPREVWEVDGDLPEVWVEDGVTWGTVGQVIQVDAK